MSESSRLRMCQRGPFPPAVFRLVNAQRGLNAPPPGCFPGGSGRVSLSDLHSNGSLSTGPTACSADQMPVETPRWASGRERTAAGQGTEQCLKPSGVHTNAHRQHCHWGSLLMSTASWGSRSGGAAAGGSLNFIARCWVTGPGLERVRQRSKPRSHTVNTREADFPTHRSGSQAQVSTRTRQQLLGPLFLALLW